MFTGLIEAIGEIIALESSPTNVRLKLRVPFAAEVQLGDSIAVNGCCLTVAEQNGDTLGFDLLHETIARTNLSSAAPGAHVNLERALAASARLGGHFVQGHADCTSEVLAYEQIGRDWRLEISLPAEFAQLVVFKGSIAVNGISLTIAEVQPHSVVLWIIPHTHAVTNLQWLRGGKAVNLEFDLLAKYVERLLSTRSS